MKLEFQTTIEESIKAQIAFAETTKFARHFKKYGIPLSSVIFFLLLLIINYPFEGKFIINEKSYPHVVAITTIIIIILFSILYGCLVYIFLKSIRKRTIKESMSKLPKDIFGKKIIEINDLNIYVETPVSQNKYRLSAIDPIILTSDFIFISAYGQLVTSIPIHSPVPACFSLPQKVLGRVQGTGSFLPKKTPFSPQIYAFLTVVRVFFTHSGPLGPT